MGVAIYLGSGFAYVVPTFFPGVVGRFKYDVCAKTMTHSTRDCVYN